MNTNTNTTKNIMTKTIGTLSKGYMGRAPSLSGYFAGITWRIDFFPLLSPKCGQSFIFAGLYAVCAAQDSYFKKYVFFRMAFVFLIG